MQGQEYEYFRKLILNTTFSFKVAGHLTRDAGQFVSINVVNNNQLSTLFGKLWQIFQITHVWESNVYINEIKCFRTIKLASDSFKRLTYTTPIKEN